MAIGPARAPVATPWTAAPAQIWRFRPSTSLFYQPARVDIGLATAAELKIRSNPEIGPGGEVRRTVSGQKPAL